MMEDAMAATARMDRDASADDVAGALGRDGYAIVERLLSAEEAAAKRAELTRILAETKTGRNDFEGYKTRRIYALFAKTRVFDDPATHPLVLGVLDRVLGPSYQLSAPVGIEISPGETAQVLHTDDGIYPIPRPHPEVVLNTMWALDDFTEENGATRVVPGSQAWVDERPGEDARIELATMPAGSVMFFTGSVFHGGGANQSDRPRLGTILEYVSGWLRPQENHVLAVPRDVVRTLTPRLQELLGYNIHPPFVGYVDGRHPRRSLEE
jgi:ectoine hydroxylase-related dioxygenase (phytanoyl-CoA dioxygenase family)